MREKSTLFVLATVAVLLFSAATAHAQTFTAVYNFAGSDGDGPVAGIIQDPAGNLYGTTYSGGSFGWGTVFKLDTADTQTVLYNFCSQTNCADGAAPWTPLARAWDGDLYGTTYFGGTSSNCRYGCGIVFKIDTAGIETVRHSFAGGTSDGCGPLQGLWDEAGTLYGTTYGCGAFGYGTIFKIDRAGKFTLLHSFAGGKSDGAYPQSGHLKTDNSGNLYGVTYGGGLGGGVLYKLSKNGTFTVLHRFGRGTDGCFPVGSVVQDKWGNLYGTTVSCGSGGSGNDGTVWKVSKRGKETILHNFSGGDGSDPWAGVARDLRGNLYGVTYGGGANYGGVLYELSKNGTYTVLHTFGANGNPYGEVWRTANDTLFGTTQYGGTGNCGYGCGTVWSYVP